MFALDKALQEMTIEENKPLKLKNLPKYSSCERNGCSLMGRLLCPENQKMSRFIHDMSRLWHVNNRARGIALSEENFQFIFDNIFDNEQDLETVLYGGAWTYEDWSMVIERWVEKPPEDYLNILPLWIRLPNIPVNYYTAETIEEIAENIGQVMTVPQSRGFVRVNILFDITRTLWNKKEVELPTGETVTIGIEYERVRKRCFQCQRLTHDKTRCPLNPQNRHVNATGGGRLAIIGPVRKTPQISADDPLYGVLTNDDVGIDEAIGRPKISREVLNEMRNYLSVQDPTEKQARIVRIRRQVWGLDKDPQGQKTQLRLEPATKVTSDVDKGKGIVYDFKVREHDKDKDGEKLLAAAIKASAQITKQGIERFNPIFARNNENNNRNGSTLLSTGIFNASSSGAQKIVKKYRRRPSQHKRKAQASQMVQAGRKVALVYKEKNKEANEEGINMKRKAVEEVDASPKLAKLDNLKVVPYEEPPKQL